MAVAIANRETLEVGAPRPLFATHATGLGIGIVGWHQYTVTADGHRFVVNEPIQEEADVPITVVVNWRARLAQ